MAFVRRRAAASSTHLQKPAAHFFEFLRAQDAVFHQIALEAEESDLASFIGNDLRFIFVFFGIIAIAVGAHARHIRHDQARAIAGARFEDRLADSVI